MAGKYNNIMITFDERGKSYNATYAISNSTYVDFRDWARLANTGVYLKEVAPVANYSNKILVALSTGYNTAPNSSTVYKFVANTNPFMHFYNYNISPQNTKEDHKSLAEQSSSTSIQPEIGHHGWANPYGQVYGYDNYWSDSYVQHLTFSIAVSDHAISGVSDGSQFLYTDLTDAVLTSPHISIILQHIDKFRSHINDRTNLHDINFVRTTAELGPVINVTELRSNFNTPRETLGSLSTRYGYAHSTGTDRYHYIKQKINTVNAVIEI